MATVTVHALEAGHLTLPERFFITPNDPEATRYVPSLSFLIQHTTDSKTTRILFDLGLRRDPTEYPPSLTAHLQSRSPYSTTPDVISSLAVGDLSPDDIDYVILSHVHYDHTGTPGDFTRSQFILGSASRSVLTGQVTLTGTHSVFEPELLPPSKCIDLPPTEPSWDYQFPHTITDAPINLSTWTSLPPFPQVMDIFRDGSVYIVDAPGHIPGHICLLCRVGDSAIGTQDDDKVGLEESSSSSRARVKYVLLAGDACHDTRLLSTHSIATWDVNGQTHCIHADIDAANETIQRIKKVASAGIEVLVDDPNDPAAKRGIGKFMRVGDELIEIQKGWYGDPRAQEPGRMDHVQPRKMKVTADVEVVLAHDSDWEAAAKAENRFWPGQL